MTFGRLIELPNFSVKNKSTWSEPLLGSESGGVNPMAPLQVFLPEAFETFVKIVDQP